MNIRHILFLATFLFASNLSTACASQESDEHNGGGSEVSSEMRKSSSTVAPKAPPRVKLDDILNLFKDDQITDSRNESMVIKRRSIVREILQPLFEIQSRFLPDFQGADGQPISYGKKFPVGPEFLYELLRECPGKSVLELGGGQGAIFSSLPIGRCPQGCLK